MVMTEMSVIVLVIRLDSGRRLVNGLSHYAVRTETGYTEDTEKGRTRAHRNPQSRAMLRRPNASRRPTVRNEQLRITLCAEKNARCTIELT